MKNKGLLYIVATPIGNLEDISFRAVRILKKVSLIATEDTRTTKKLLTHYNIQTPLTSYHEHNEREKAKEILELLNSGSDVALVSEAGTPVVSDPGYRLTSKAVEEGVTLIPIPGPTAMIAAISVSGLPTDRFLFVGFLPDKEGKRRKKLEEVAGEIATLIFYISKWKIEKVLVDMLDILGDRRICYCRELTKLHEEIDRTTLSVLLDEIQGKVIKGEITLVVEGNRGQKIRV